MPHFSTILAFLFLLVSGGMLIQLLRWYYEAPRDNLPRWISRWEFSPQDIDGTSYFQLAIVSSLSLFLELMVIRWISSEVGVFAYFKNFVLVACFLGLGFGCYLSRRAINLLALFAPLVLLAFLVSSLWHPMREAVGLLPSMLAPGTAVQIWGVPTLQFGVTSIPMLADGLIVSAILFLLIGFFFVPLGQIVGWCLEHARHGMTGYSLNVFGSIVGTLLYTALCFWFAPPSIWFAVAAVLFVILMRKKLRLMILSVAALAFCALVSLPPHGADTQVYWSPYQKLTLTAIPNSRAPEHYDLLTNESWYQQIVNLSPEFIRAHAEEFKREPVDENPYNLPYRFYPAPGRVLILGAGMGNDVAAAIRNTKANITAVEIDPLIVSLGKQLHFEHPYASSRVRIVVNDARNYIQNSPDKFDLIVFSLLDSQTTSSSYSNIRIDNYVYTVEALTAAKRLLEPEGVFVIKFQTDTPWIAGRLQELLESVFHQTPIRLQRGGAIGAQEEASSWWVHLHD